MEPAVPLSRFSPRLGDWRETDGRGRLPTGGSRCCRAGKLDP